MAILETFAIIISILMSVLVIYYIATEFLPKKKVKIDKVLVEHQPDPEVEKILSKRGKNKGESLSQQKVVDNTAYILDNYGI
jgi:methionine salvage enolase-phosphatase E1